MTTLYVQFSDETETVIQSVFANPQDPEIYPNQGEVDTSDERYRAFYNSLPLIIRNGLPEPD